MLNERGCRNAYSIMLLMTVLATVGVMTGCGSTQQANLWADPEYTAAPMKKIMVIAMSNDPLRRRMWEDAVVTSFGGTERSGTIAVASYQLFPDSLPDTLASSPKTREEGFDGVLVVARAQRDTISNEVEGYVSSEPVTRYSRRWNIYETYYEDVYYPGYVETETIVSVRTDLLLPLEDGKLVWSVTSQSVDPTSADQFRISVADRIVSELRKGRFIS